jgi:hypothetical protein
VSPVKYELGLYIPEDDILHCLISFSSLSSKAHESGQFEAHFFSPPPLARQGCICVLMDASLTDIKYLAIYGVENHVTFLIHGSS